MKYCRDIVFCYFIFFLLLSQIIYLAKSFKLSYFFVKSFFLLIPKFYQNIKNNVYNQDFSFWINFYVHTTFAIDGCQNIFFFLADATAIHRTFYWHSISSRHHLIMAPQLHIINRVVFIITLFFITASESDTGQ